MRLEADFGSLHRAVRAMGAEHVEVRDVVGAYITDREPVDWELPEGIEVDVDDIQAIRGLLSYKDRHVLLYIQDHTWNADGVLSGHHVGNKYHVA